MRDRMRLGAMATGHAIPLRHPQNDSDSIGNHNSQQIGNDA
jgi:hypothetical protein